MSVLTPERSLPAMLGAAVFSAGLLTSLLGAPHHAHAAIGCRTDPIVTLSNGLVVDLSATIYDTLSDINAVTYTLHAPVGTSVVSVVYPVDPNNIPQTFTFYADNPAGTWDSYTYVDTKTTGVSVTATAEVANLAVFSANGTDHQNVQIHVQQGGQGGGDGQSAQGSGGGQSAQGSGDGNHDNKGHK